MTTPIGSNSSANAATNNNAQAGNVSGNGTISNMFTTLLVAQIKNQDPMSPQDPSAMVTQLTQLSQMEALQKLQTQGLATNEALASMQMLGLGSQVGSVVQARVDQLHLGKQPVQAAFTLASSATPATLVLTDAMGAERRIELGQRGLGSHEITIDPAALGLAEGDYQVRIENELKQATALEVKAELSSVRMDGAGGAVLSLGGLAQVMPGAITAFLGRSTAAH